MGDIRGRDSMVTELDARLLAWIDVCILEEHIAVRR